MAAEFQLAVKSKRQGDERDYRVLASSEGRLKREDFESLFKELSVGTMPFNPRSKGEGQPWITVGAFRGDGVRTVATIRQVWTTRLDASGRPVAALLCLCVPDRVLADYAPSYAKLSALIPGQQFFLDADPGLLTGPELAFGPAAEDLPAIASAVDETGFEFCARVAALLLQGPVVVMQGQELSVETRLSFLDAVAGLLPYGCRADLNASTWMSSTTEKIRISFSNVVLPTQTRVGWRADAAELPELEGEAARYYDHLLGIRQHFGCDTRELVARLSEQRRPLSFGDAASFVRALRELDTAYFFNRGLADAAETRWLLRKDSSKLDRDEVVRSLDKLLKEPRVEDMDILRKHWDRSLWVPACEAVKGKLQTPVFQDETLRALCDFAAERGWLDNFLDSLLEPDSDATRGKALGLLFYALENFGEEQYDWKRVRYFLFRSPRTLYGFLFMLGSRARSEEEIEEVMTWLEDDDVNRDELSVYARRLGLPPGELSSEEILAPFRAAFGLRNDVDVTLDMIRLLDAFDGRGDEYVLRLVDTASRNAVAKRDYSIVRKLASPVSSWLLRELARRGDAEKVKWEEVVVTLPRQPKVSVEVDARLDLLALLMWSPPPSSLLFDEYVTQSPGEVGEYASHFAAQLPVVGLKKQEVIGSLVAYIAKPRQRTEEQIAGETRLLSEVVEHVESRDAQDAVAERVARNVAEYPALLTHEAFSDELRRRLRVWGAGQRMLDGAVDGLWKLARGRRGMDEVLDHYVATLGLGGREFEWRVVDALNANGYFATAEKVRDFIVALRDRLKGHYGRDEAAAAFLGDFVDALLAVRSEAVAEYYREQLASMVQRLDQLGREVKIMSKHLEEEDAKELKDRLERMRSMIRGRGFWGGMKR